MSLLGLKRKRDIRRQRGQFLAVAITIALGVFLFASTYDAYRNLDGSYNATYDRLSFADITVVGVDPGFVDTAEQIDGVATAEARQQADIPARVGDQTLLATVIGYPADHQPEINKISVTEGTYLEPADPFGVVIETHMAVQFDLGIGDTVDIFSGGTWNTATVDGIAVSAEYIWPARNNQDIFPPPGTFGVIFVSSDLMTEVPVDAVQDDVSITYTQDADRPATDAAVTAAAHDAGAANVIPRADQASNSTLLLDVNGFASMSVLFPVLFMAAAGMAAFVLLTRIVFAQRGIIGTLRASGMTRRHIANHFLGYGIRLGLVAGIVGIVTGIAAAYAITGIYTSQLDIPDTVRSFHWVTPIIGMAFALAAGALGAWAPARRAVRIAPAEAMRGPMPEGPGRVSLFERVVPPLRRLRVRWLMILRGLGRNKRRSFSTILGVILGLVLIMVSWGMLDSIVILLDRQFTDVTFEDADIVVSTPVTDATVNEIDGVDGVAATEIVARVDATVSFGDETFAATLFGYKEGTVMHGFPDGVPTDGILAGSGLAGHLDVDVGDDVGISLPTLGQTFDTRLVGFLDEPVGVALYMDRDRLASIIGEDAIATPTVSQLQSKFDSTVTDRDAVISGIRDLDEVAFVSDARALYDLMHQYLGFFYAFIGVMLILGAAMAFALMYNAVSVNVAERSTEFATMRASGLSHKSIAGLIAFENILLTLFGIIPGAVVGYAVGTLFMTQFSVEAFTLTFVMRPWSIAVSMLAMVVAAVLSLIPSIRRVRHIDLAKSVRERAV